MADGGIVPPRRLLSVLLAGAVISLPAEAVGATERFSDAPMDQEYAADIHTVVVRHADRRVRVRVLYDDFKITQYSSLTVWFDTRAKRRGPEFVVALYPATEFSLQTSTDWRRGKYVRCAASAWFVMGRSEEAWLSVPRRCLGDPSRVRVSVRSTELYATRVFHDWAPARRSFYPWVGR